MNAEETEPKMKYFMAASRFFFASIKGRQGIGGQAGQLEPHEQGDEINGAGNHHHANGGKEQQCEVLVCALSRVLGQ